MSVTVIGDPTVCAKHGCKLGGTHFGEFDSNICPQCHHSGSCPTHWKSHVWDYKGATLRESGPRCGICGYWFDGREPSPGEPVVVRSLNHYQDYTMARSGARSGEFKRDLIYSALAIAGEAGEYVDALKKVYYHEHELDKEKLALELGDILWSITAAATELGYSMEEIARINIEKIKRRYPPDGYFTREQSRNRASAD